jgi:hypothetical protein
MWRHVAITVFAIAMFVVCSGAIVLSVYQGASPHVPIMLGMFDALIVLFLVKVGFYRSTVEVSSRGVSITGGPLGLGRRRWVDVGDIARFEAKGEASPYYYLLLVCRDQQRITIGKWLPGPRLIASVIGEIEQTLGTRPSDSESAV